MSKQDNELWTGDLLGRKDDADYIIQLLTNRIKEDHTRPNNPNSFILNLDAKWGHGKTFFLTEIKKQLEAGPHNFPVVYINAWESDYAADPLIPIIAELDALFQQQKPSIRKSWKALKPKALSIAKTAGSTLSKELLKKGLSETIDALGDEATDAIEEGLQEGGEAGIEKLFDSQSESLLQAYRRKRRSIERFKSGLASIIRDKKKPLVLLVDELDRCRPSYAVELLERVKHLFAVDGLVFIIATDTEQLQHAVSSIYGQEFESRRYLHRFFDYTYTFDEPELADFVNYQFKLHGLPAENYSSPNITHQELVLGAFRTFGLGLRDVEQCIDILRTVTTHWPYPTKIELVPLLPFIIAHQQSNTILFEFLKARGSRQELDRMVKSPAALMLEFHQGHPPRGPTMENFSFTSVVRKFLSAVDQSKNYILKEHKKGVDAWIARRLHDEVSTFKNCPKFRELSGSSQITTYPTLVRSAGRISSV